MNQCLYFVLVFLIYSLIFNGVSASNGVIVELTDNNFDAMTGKGAWLLEFHVPSCGHCKNLSPILDEAASTIDSNVLRIGTIDCNKQKHLAKKFEIKSYPTLKFSRDGYTRAYSHGRKLEEILSFAEIISRPSTSAVTFATFASQISAAKFEVNFVLFSDTNDSRSKLNKNLFEVASQQLQGRAGFFSTTDKQLAEHISMPAKASVARISEGSDTIWWPSKSSKSSLVEWIHQNKIASLPELDSSVLMELLEHAEGRPLILIVYNPSSSPNTHVIDTGHALSKVFSKDFVFAKLNGVLWKSWLDNFGIKHDQIPTIFALDYANEVFITAPEDNVLRSLSSSATFLNQIITQELEWRSPNPWNPIQYIRRLTRKLEQLLGPEFIVPISVLGIILFIGMILLIISRVDNSISSSSENNTETKEDTKKNE